MTPACVALCSWRPLASCHLPLPFPETFNSVGGGAPPPLTTLCRPSPRLAYPHLPTPPSFPFEGCANRAPGLSLFHCSVSGSTRRRATALSVGQVRSSGHPIPAVGDHQMSHAKGGDIPPSPSRAPSPCPATVSLTADASLNGICNREKPPQPLSQHSRTACLTASGAPSRSLPF